MKSILRLSILVYLATIGVTLSAVDSAQIDVEMKRVETLRRALDDGGVPAMLALGLPCPLIHSQYYADKIAAREPKRRSLEQAKRDFGLKVAHFLDDQAAAFQKHASSAERAQQATSMLDFADWLRATRGYGNYLLFSRSESLAAMPLVYLTADLDYPLANIAALRQRIVSTATERASRVEVLSDEAPEPFIDNLHGTDAQQDDQVQAAWNKKWQTMAAWFKTRGFTGEAQTRERLPEDLGFFFEEHVPSPLTTTNTWPNNRHASLVFGLRDVQVRNLDEFMLYREKVGTFPLQPPKWWKPNPANSSDTARRAAFQDGVKHLRRENGQPFGYSTAAMLYQQASEGKVMDYETQLMEK